MENNEIIEKIRKTAKALDEEKITEFLVDDTTDMKFEAKLNNTMKFQTSFKENPKMMQFTKSEFCSLKEIVVKNHDDLINCANGYKTSGRDFEYFFYDLFALVWYLDKLPPIFNKLKKDFESHDKLMHNRVVAQIAYHYHKLNYKLESETKYGNKKPDLKINGQILEVKTLISPAENTPDYFKKFSLNFTECVNSALEQIPHDGMIAIAPWSQIMNNYFKGYFLGYYSNNIQPPSNGSIILVLDGGKVLEDFYLIFNSKDDAINMMNKFAESGHEKLDPMIYMQKIKRSGIPIFKSGDMRTMSDIGIGFTIG